MVRSFAVAAALGVLFSIATSSMAQTRPATKPADKPAPKAGGTGSPTDPTFPTTIDKVSYGIGLELGSNNRVYLQQMVGPLFKDLNFTALVWGIRDGITEENGSRVSEAELKVAHEEFGKRVMQVFKELGDKNLKSAQAVLATNKSKQGVKTTKSGLQYKVIKSGKGATPRSTDFVRVHYHGTRPDGSIFDSTKESQQPADLEFALLIPGWQEALSMMKEGDEWELWVPPDLAYGERGRDGIEPNTLLKFNLQLVSIVKPDELAAPGETEEPKAKPATKAASSAAGGTTKRPASPK